MPSSYQVALWKQQSFLVLRPLQIEFFRSLLEDMALKAPDAGLDRNSRPPERPLWRLRARPPGKIRGFCPNGHPFGIGYYGHSHVRGLVPIFSLNAMTQ